MQTAHKTKIQLQTFEVFDVCQQELMNSTLAFLANCIAEKSITHFRDDGDASSVDNDFHSLLVEVHNGLVQSDFERKIFLEMGKLQSSVDLINTMYKRFCEASSSAFTLSNFLLL
jgi:hypothetical protein